MMELLDLSQAKSNSEVSDLIKERVKSVNCSTLVEELSTDFIYHEEAVRRVYAALATGKNAILYGPGGFGKSVIIKAICKYYGIPVICKIGYEGMTAEELLGVPNMDKLLNESKYETAFENSVFCTPGLLLLEEFFDADPSTAAALKDVLTEKGFREGGGRKESLISSVIITGNKTPEDVSVDDTTKAFYKERFPFRHKMVWNTFEESDYMSFFKVFYGNQLVYDNRNKLRLVARLCAGTDSMVSPRIAAEAADTVIELGVEFLDTVTDIDTTLLIEMKNQVEKEATQLSETELLERIQKKVIVIVDALRRDPDIEEILIYRLGLRIINNKFTEYTFSNDTFKQLTELKSLVQTAVGTIEHLLTGYVDIGDIDEEITQLFNGK